jgi:hypothetical protein
MGIPSLPSIDTTSLLSLDENAAKMQTLLEEERRSDQWRRCELWTLFLPLWVYGGSC